jgi:hypothetical protein
MRMILLGAPRGLNENRWKDDIAEAGVALGWSVEHLESRGADIEKVLDLCKSADLFVWARTHGHEPMGDGGVMLRRIEALGVPTVGIHMDLYFGIQIREPRIGDPEQHWWSCQHVFTADGGHQAEFAELGVNHHWMPPAMGVRFFGRIEDPVERAFVTRHRLKAVFVGSNVKHIHTQHRSELIRWAANRYGNRFKHYGDREGIYGERLNHLYTSTRFALGDSAPSDYYWSDRIPITMGRGGVLAYPRTIGLEEQGFNETNMIMYDRYGFEELGERLDSMSDKEVSDMSEAAIALVGERHLWTHRLLEIQRKVQA